MAGEWPKRRRCLISAKEGFGLSMTGLSIVILPGKKNGKNWGTESLGESETLRYNGLCPFSSALSVRLLFLSF